MTDKEKLEKIRSEVIWYIHLRNEGLIIGSCGDFEKLLKFIDSLQEEPVSVWHDASEMPKEKKVCLIRYSANDGASTNNFEVVIAEPLTRRFVTRSYPHKTGYQHTIRGENTIKVDEYQNRREYIPFSDIDEWAYIDDLLNLSNVEKTVKSWKDAQGDDLPEIDREVIVLLNNGRVAFGHRPPEYWDGKDIITGKVTRNYVERYDKGLWNIPNAKYWLDVDLPKQED